MPGLKKKLDDFLKIADCKMHYTFYNGFILEFEFKKTNFPHMAGLHKLKDINIIQTYLGKQGFANQILSKIKKGALTEADIRTSKYFPGIQKRYEEFTLENLFSLSYSDVIIDFDITKLAKSRLKNTKFILFEKNKNQENRHLCIAGNQTGGFYPETFFFESSDYYVKNQTLEKIKQFQIIKADGSIYFEDNF
ncbi:MAG: hypothetical protein J6Y30_09305 [Treponema sp.]|nr:hypothetical protein [Treponema sp.]